MYRAKRSDLPGGLRGVGKTVKTMRALIDQGGRDPRIIKMTRGILLSVPERHSRAEVRKLFDHVRGHVRFVNDPVNVETLVEPGTMADEIELQGMTSEDCDGHVVLLGSMLEAAGYPTEIAVESYRKDGQPSHVTLNAQLGTGTIHLDPTVKDAPMGSFAGQPSRQYAEGGFAMLGDRPPPFGQGIDYLQKKYPPRSAGGAPSMDTQSAAAETQQAGGGGAGVTEELTGKNETDAWTDIVEGITSIGNWAMQTPLVQNVVLEQKLKMADNALSLSKKHGTNYMKALGFDMPEEQYPFVGPLEEDARPRPGAMPTWGWVAIGAGVFAFGAILMMRK